MPEASSNERVPLWGNTPMPSVGEARHALAIHGERGHFRTVTISFDDPQDALDFDARVRGDSTTYAVLWALENAHTGIKVVTRP
jgi:hypothetical protein